MGASKFPEFTLDFGESNHLEDLGAKRLKGKASVRSGSGNRLTVGSNSVFNGVIRFEGDNNRILIGKECHFAGQILVKGNNQTVAFGDHSTTAGDTYILCQEDCDVLIGGWCMLSRGIEIRTTDAHSVISRTTGQRLNKAKSVSVGDHVWIGVGALLSKGAGVAADSIVGAKAFVGKVFEEEGVVIAGVPARIVKRGITWHRSRRDRFRPKDLDPWRGEPAVEEARPAQAPKSPDPSHANGAHAAAVSAKPDPQAVGEAAAMPAAAKKPARKKNSQAAASAA